MRISNYRTWPIFKNVVYFPYPRFNASGFSGASSALFFVVMLAHIQLRRQFAGANIVYIEYFYILMYAMLVLATVNTYLFSIRASGLGNIILYKDNLIPKVAY